MERNSELVDFERGSTFGGIITTFVLVGFIGVLIYDLKENISNKPYTFKVRDRSMKKEEVGETELNFADYNQSLGIYLDIRARDEKGVVDTSFDMLDNDYFRVISSYWDGEKSYQEGKSFWYLRSGPELRKCDDKEVKMMASGFDKWY